tara:strand:- start:797 stop:943 length:147 start_codon:yes stop_codon:yes gene_type:complete
MKNYKAIVPFFAALGAFYLTNNSPMWKQMNKNNPVENEIKSIPVEEFK